jgi:hypothetical protein
MRKRPSALSLPMVLASSGLVLTAVAIQQTAFKSAAGRKEQSAQLSSASASTTTSTSTTSTTAPPPPPPPPPPLPPPTTSPPTTQPRAVASASTSSLSGGVWAELRQCESGGNYQDNTGNGYYGAYQFDQSTWNSLGLSGLPSQASPATQDQAAKDLQARDGWAPWPSCSRKLGLS